MSEQKHTPMVVAAAREMCRISSEACAIDNEDNWKIYGYQYLADAVRVLSACGAPELLEALAEILADGMHCDVVPHLHAKALAAIRKATGQS